MNSEQFWKSYSKFNEERSTCLWVCRNSFVCHFVHLKLSRASRAQVTEKEVNEWKPSDPCDHMIILTLPRSRNISMKQLELSPG